VIKPECISALLLRRPSTERYNNNNNDDDDDNNNNNNNNNYGARLSSYLNQLNIRGNTANFSGVMSELSLVTCTPNLKSVALTVLELLAFNT